MSSKPSPAPVFKNSRKRLKAAVFRPIPRLSLQGTRRERNPPKMAGVTSRLQVGARRGIRDKVAYRREAEFVAHPSFLTRLLRSSLHGLGYETKKLDRRFSVADFNFEPSTCSVGLTPQGETTGRAAARMIGDRNLSDLRVLDICCGEGIVGLTIFAECRNRIKELHFTDINIFNLNSVRRTLKINNLDAIVRQGDIQTWLSDGL